MRCLRGLTLIGIILLPLFLISGGAYRQNSVDLLYKVMSETGANLEESSVHGWSRLPPGTWTADTLKNTISQGIASRGERPENYQFDSNSTEEHYSVRAVRVSGNHRETIAAVARKDESAAFMTVTIAGSTGQISSWEQQTAKILHSSGGIPSISSCLVGWINGKLDNGEWTDILSHSFALLDATRIDEMDDARVSSVIGYSSRLPGDLLIDGVRVNINMASRYSSADNRTYITLGTPIIAREY